MDLKQKVDRRLTQIQSAGFGSFAQKLREFWRFFDREPVLNNIRESLNKQFPNISDKVSLTCKNSIIVETKSEDEDILLTIEILRHISVSDSFRGNLQATCFPSEFSMSNCKSQIEIDENYLKVFKDLYLEKFSNYIEEQLEDYEMINKKDEDLKNQQNSTYIFHAPVGAVQPGNNNVANVNQNIGQNFSEILEQLAILKNQFQSLSSDEREEAIEVIDAIAVEVQSEKPSKGKIKSFLLTTKDFAVKTGTELAASTLAKLLESQMGIKG